MFLVFLYLFNLYIRPQDWVPFFYGWPVDYLVIIPALLVGYIKYTSNRKKSMPLPQIKLLIAALAIVFLSNAVHGNVGFGIQELIVFMKKSCIFLIVLLLVKSTSNLKNTMFFIVLLSSFIAAQAIFQCFSGNVGFAGQDFYHSGVGVRTKWVGLWDGANVTALLLSVSVPFALEFSFGPYSILYRIVNFICAVCLIWGVYTTNSRGGFLTLIAILCIYPITRLKNKKNAIILAAVLGIIGVLYFSPSRMNEMSTDEESAHIRTRLWGAGIEMFKQNPVLGVGKGKFIESPENSRNMMAHSNFIQNLGETGIVGIFVWMSLIYFSVKGLNYGYKLKAEPNTSSDTLKSLARALFVSILGFYICTIFVTMDIDIFYLLLGLCAVTINIINREIKYLELKFSLKDVRNIIGLIIIMLLFYHFYTK